MKERLRQLLALVLMVTVLLSSAIVYAEEEIATELPLEETTEEIATEEEAQIQRIIGSTEFEDEKDKLVLYVATDGDDKNEGTIDKPLKSLEGAQMKIREIKKTSGLPEGGAIVYFRGGTYMFEKGVKFTSEDSGTENARITYRNYPDEKVDFVGARTLSWDDFKKVTDEKVLSKIIDKNAREHIYATDLKALGFKELNPPVWPGSYSYWSTLMPILEAQYGITAPKSKSSELFINDKSMTIARYPNDGFMTIKSVIESGVESSVYANTPAEDAAKLDAPPTEIEVADKRILEWEGVKGAIMYGTFSLSWATQATEMGSINKKTNSMDNNILINCMESFRLTRSFNYGNPDNFTVYHETTAQVPVKSELWMNAFPGIENVIDEEGKPDMNNYIVATDNVLINTPLPTTSEQVKATATIENNITFGGDPGFYDMENRNYLLNEDSEVFEKIPDFEPIPFTRIGMYTDRAMSRIKNAYVFCVNSPYVYKNGQRVKSSKNEAIIENDTLYVPLRSGAEAIGATVDFNEETNNVIVSVSGKAMEFVSNGSLDSVKVNGQDYKLSKPVINKEYTNYISLEDLVNIFEKHLVLNNNIAVVSDIEKLFTMGADDGLLRYIEEQLTIY
ncbi:MAG: hypothetical protein J6A69_09585 [Clostridia bacterium]|nr:hypothetical protein [Clostridia bacterium]